MSLSVRASHVHFLNPWLATSFCAAPTNTCAVCALSDLSRNLEWREFARRWVGELHYAVSPNAPINLLKVVVMTRNSFTDRTARPRGFTLVELLVVIAIIGILVAL